jgi:cerevisin
MDAFDVQYVRPPPSVERGHSDPSLRTDASWNLARVSSSTKLTNQDPFALDYEYKYLPEPGSGIDIYVVDTGLFSRLLQPSKGLDVYAFQVSSLSMWANFV